MPVREFSDKANRNLEEWIEEVLAEADRAYTGEDLTAADEALGWLDRFLRDEPMMRDAVSLVSLGRAFPEVGVDRALRRRREAADRMIRRRQMTEGSRQDLEEVAEATAKWLAWAELSKMKEVRAELYDRALALKRRKLRRRIPRSAHARKAARAIKLTDHDRALVAAKRDRGVELSAKAMLAREIAAIRKAAGGGRLTRADVMPGRSFNSRSLYDWAAKGFALIADGLNAAP
jgi:hypothetical protein